MRGSQGDSGWRRWLVRAASGVGLLVIFVASLLAGLVLHMNTRPARRVAQQGANWLFRAQFAGQIVVGEVERLTPRALRVTQFTATEPRGGEVLTAQAIRLRGPWLLDLLRLGLAGRGTLSLDYVRVERASLELEIGPQKSLTLADAFGPRPKAHKSEDEPSRSEPADVALDLAHIELGEVRVHGSLGAAVPIDALVSRLLARFRISPEGLALDVKRTSLREHELLGAATSGTADYHLVAVAEPQRLGMWGTFSGHVGTLELGTTVIFDDGRLSVTLDLPRVGAEELRPWLPARPLTEAVSASARFDGVPPLFDLAGEVQLPAMGPVPSGELAMRGRLRIGDEPMADVQLAVEHLNAQLFGSDLPATSLTARARLRANLAGDDTELRAQIRTASSVIGGEPIPPVEGVVAYARAGIEAYLRVAEDGLPIGAELAYRADAGLRFAARAHAPELASVPRLRRLLATWAGAGVARGRVALLALGEVHDGVADIAIDSTVIGASWPCRGTCAKAQLSGAHIATRIRGELDDLQLEAAIVGGGLTLGGERFDSFRVHAQGPIAAPSVRAVAIDARQRKLEALAVVEPAKATVRNVSLSVGRGGTVLKGRIAQVTASGGAVRIDGVSVHGGTGGKLEGSLQVKNQELVGKLVGAGIDLEPLARLLDLPYPLTGVANVDIDLSRDETGRHGHAKLTIQDAGMLVISGVNLELEAQFDGQRVRPEVKLSLVSEALSDATKDDPCAGTIATIGFEKADGTIIGPLLSAATWREVSGSGTLTLGQIKLRCLAEVWDQFDPTRPIPFERIDGIVDGSLELARRPQQRLPSLKNIQLRTEGLALALRRPAPDAPPSWSTDRLDLALGGAIDGVSGETSFDVRLLSSEPKEAGAPPAAASGSELARLYGGIELDLDGLLSGGPKARDALVDGPARITGEVGRRPIQHWTALPVPIGEHLGSVAGDIELSAYLEGTLRRPALAVRARGHSLAPATTEAAGGGQWALPVDLDLLANYYDGTGRLEGSVSYKNRQIASLDGTLEGNPSARRLGQFDDRWTGSLTAELTALPLDSLPALARAGVSGALSGRLALQDLRSDAPGLNVDLDVADLSFDRGVTFDRATFRAHPVGDGRDGVIAVQSELDVRGGGGLRFAGYGSLNWRDGLVPQMNLEAPAAMLVTADRFPVRTALPLMSEPVSRLGGQLDGAIRITHHELLDRVLSIDADMTLSNGIVHMPGLGQELHDVNARLTSTPNLIRIEDITASAARGRSEGWMVIQLDGTTIKTVTGSFTVPETEQIPLAVQGVPLGTASGRLILSIQNRPEEVDVRLTAAQLRVRLPASSSNRVQPLADHPDVVLSHSLRPPKDAEGSQRGSPYGLTVTLVDAQVDSGSLRIQFGTEPDKPIRMDTDGSLSGELGLSDGELNLLGKVFEIDRGLVRLRHQEPGNPYVNVTSHWNAPDGSIVYCDYEGLLKPIAREKIRFRSNPPRTEQEIVSLLILGEGQDSAGPGGADA
ncbi:MAG: hypothetical protein DRI90_12295, partial [Deltaproteobacteria bacterium]